MLDEYSDLIHFPFTLLPKAVSYMPDGGYIIEGPTPFGDPPNTAIIFFAQIEMDALYMARL